MADENYEHWADGPSSNSSAGSSSARSRAVAGYTIHNGLRKFSYEPTNQDKNGPKADDAKSQKSKSSKSSKCKCAPPPKPKQEVEPAPAPTQTIALQPSYYTTGGYPIMQYAPMAQQMTYSVPAFYGYPQAGVPMQICLPAVAPAVFKETQEKPRIKPKVKPEPLVWQGRSMAEVEEDNMKIAQREGVCDSRKVEPKGLADDQLVWCVETDGSHTLRYVEGGWEVGRNLC